MSKSLVIVESPAKAKTVSRIVGNRYSVKASLGHVRDLPKSKLGVDVENDFAPKYLVPKVKRAVVRQITEAAKKASSVYLATDPDREGEAISWHLVQAAQLDDMPLRRVVFHEITKEAVTDAFRHSRGIDMDLVNAQQARRILDRLVGYKLSPLLWRKVRRGLSAGRVQSVTLRMVVDREREIEGFIPREYWSIDAELKKIAGEESFRASLIGLIDGKKIEIQSEKEAKRIVTELKRVSYAVVQVRKKDLSRQPAPPFTTSTLQQEGWRKLRFSAKRTMAIAQQLYEGLPMGKEGTVGLITYMRTDSTRVASSALNEARAYIKEKYGADFLPPRPRIFAKKAKAAQEAHEAIRPTSVRREPDIIKRYLNRDQFRLYELIWKRMVASQMSPVLLDTTSVDIEAKDQMSYLLRATSSVIKFPGFTILYSEGKDDAQEERMVTLPPLVKGEKLQLLALFPDQHFTQPPPRYTEATLVKALEERGIGRPSTYAPILSTIQERGYVEKADGRFHPLELGLVVSDLLSQHFPDIVDPKFTAQMEDGLDQIARGERQWVPFLQDFYQPFEKSLKMADERMEKVKVVDEPTDETCEQCGRPMVIKLGRYGRFIACSGYPECKNTRPLVVKIGVKCPKCGGDLVQRQTKKRRTFYGCANYPACDFATSDKPIPQPCPQCGGLMAMRGKKMAKCLKCEFSTSMAELEREAVEV
ncbi:MAG: type I DNA topoisomerase [Dehalococcoidia bacterium]|nr:type I DNA topoisomerase [Chloroflexota bacterium]MCK4242023.1 type I DNA topoisomerase [Dehalococcoidia bacterium]